jgi:hypothetical protein
MMTEKLAGMSSLTKTTQKSRPAAEMEQATIQQLVKAARERGDDLTGPGRAAEAADEDGVGDRAG